MFSESQKVWRLGFLSWMALKVCGLILSKFAVSNKYNCSTLKNQEGITRSEKKNKPYFADLDRVAEQSSQTGVFLMPGEIVLQTAQWNILHDQLEHLTAYTPI